MSNSLQTALKNFDFETLFFEELGWDQYQRSLDVDINGETYTLQAIAEKCSFVVFRCTSTIDRSIPSRPIRQRIDTQVSKSFREHLIIFTDARQTMQIWQWVRLKAGYPSAFREQRFERSQSGEALIQKLTHLAYSLEEEEQLSPTIVDVSGRVRAAFDVERVTRRFYDRFKAEQVAFANFLQGIPDEDFKRWYVSVMLNRLMFIYFIQKKRFLDSDPDYLRNRLTLMQYQGRDRYYRDFLCPLFFQGFAQKKRPPEVEHLLGQVPYLNGGLFLRHQVEERYGEAIQISDGAFERLFEFFEQYQWHLDERPLRDDREINPDVLGYIFEKYINQKQMGAYYTKEDITEYIGKNTILPYLLDQVWAAQPAAFDSIAWPLLQADPERYIYPAVLHGAGLELPPEIEAGVHEVAKRTEWNKPAPSDYALPTEIWREVVARRQSCAELCSKLSRDEIRQVNDLITYNLDIRQFAQDVIAAIEAPDLLRSFFKALGKIKVLDPTVGSGAFLFAALNILEPLYEACLERMQGFLDDLDASGEKHRPEKLKDFREILGRVDQHPNERYFILKSIIVHNLYGVDIMEEAVEICKLRLFLKLVAQVDTTELIEPLPDIDFNVRSGNTLVGFASQAEVKAALTQEGAQGKMLLFEEDRSTIQRIEHQAEDIALLFLRLQQQQTEVGGEVKPDDKQALRQRLKVLDDELNQALARQYGVDPADAGPYSHWAASHKPFHWFVEFYDIMKSGGFDVIIGNPPYLNLNGFSDYKLINYQTIDTNNLYPLVLERCMRLITIKGRQGYIVPISSTATEGYLSLQKILSSRQMFISCFDDRPSHLFNDLDKNTLSIILLAEFVNNPIGVSTRLCRWNGAERSKLFHLLQYQPLQKNRLPGCLTKIGSSIETNIWTKIWANDRAISTFYSRYGRFAVYYSRKINAFLQVLNFMPEVRDGKGLIRPPSEFKQLNFDTKIAATSVHCCLSSSLFRWFVDVTSDGSHLNKREIDNFPFDPSKMAKEEQTIVKLVDKLSENLKATSEKRTMRYTHDTLTVECIIPKFSKSIIDEADSVLARHYSLTDEELDFIINYDIKYRIGGELDDDTEE